jgi:bacterioferritin-associated ferredoxin
MLSATLPETARTYRGQHGYVCACLQITEQQLLNTLSSEPVCSLRDLRRTIGAGDGCTACHDVLRQYLEADGRRPEPGGRHPEPGAQASCPPICSDR